MVDSVIRCRETIEAHGSTRVQYWITCGRLHRVAVGLHKMMQEDGIDSRQEVTEQSWRHWLERSAKVRAQIPPEYADRFVQSMFIAKAHIDSRGAVIASTDTTMLNYARDAYGYCWTRDAVNVLWPLLRMGYVDEVQRFFEFCRRGITEDGFMMHKYLADSSIGSSWHPYVFAGKPEPPIQEDETACIIFLMGQYYKQTGDVTVVKQYYEQLIVPMANFLVHYIDRTTGLPHPSYDLWEEHFLTSTYTVGMTYGAL